MTTDISKVYIGPSEQDQKIQNSVIRQLLEVASNQEAVTLTSSADYFVGGAGASDNNPGTNSAAPFQTIQKAINTVSALYNPSQLAIAIQVANGTYTENLVFPPLFPDALEIATLVGNTGAPDNVIIDGGAYNYGRGWEVDGFKLLSSAGSLNLMECDAGGFINLQNVNFGADTGGQHVFAHNGSTIYMNTPYMIEGGANSHWVVESNSLIRGPRGNTITITSTPAFATAFAVANAGRLQIDNITFSGSATGPRFAFTDNASAQTGTTNLNYLPGNSAGTCDLGSSFGTLTAVAPNGFLSIATTTSSPSGTPSTLGGLLALLYDTGNNKLWVYNGAWRGVALS